MHRQGLRTWMVEVFFIGFLIVRRYLGENRGRLGARTLKRYQSTSLEGLVGLYCVGLRAWKLQLRAVQVSCAAGGPNYSQSTHLLVSFSYGFWLLRFQVT